MAWNPDLSYGLGGETFGHQDYTGALKEVWDAGGKDRQKNLIQRRRDVLAWMDQEENRSKIAEANLRGQTGGLYSDIQGGALSEKFQGVAIGGDTAPQSANWIGQADILAGRAAGHSWDDIGQWLSDNQSLLRESNRPGKGGIYDEIQTERRIENLTGDWTDALDETKTDISDAFTGAIGSQTDKLSGSFEKGMGGVSDAITAQTAASDKYRADQAQWQRKQDQMQQMMLYEQRRKAKEKPVVKILPGASAFGGGGGGGAGAFARKKKQTTGLNIA